MNVGETLVILRLAKGLCPAMQLDDYTPDAWTLALKDYRMLDVQNAVVEVAKRKPFIDLAAIISEIKAVRAARFDKLTSAEVDEMLGASAPDPDDIPAFLDAVRAERKAIADGVPVEQAAGVADGRSRPVAALVAGLADKKTLRGRGGSDVSP